MAESRLVCGAPWCDPSEGLGHLVADDPLNFENRDFGYNLASVGVSCLIHFRAAELEIYLDSSVSNLSVDPRTP
jgi:hypothetical protein